jgi:hypothetical protein
VGTAIVVCSTSAFAAGGHAKKPASVKTGTYKAKSGGTRITFTPPQFNITLKRTKCTSASGQGTPALHLCVALPITPQVECTGPLTASDSLGSFLTPVALSSSGKITEHMAVTTPGLPGSPASTGQATFSVTFTKKGTASGYIEETLSQTFGTEVIPCTSGKVPFTAKLG